VLVPPGRGFVSTLYFEIERKFRLTEKGVVYFIWAIGIVFGVISVLMTLAQVALGA